MPAKSPPRTKEELFKEFKLKVDFLTGEPYEYSRKEIGAVIGISPENLSHYLKKTSLSAMKLRSMLNELNTAYADVFKREEFLPANLKPYIHDELSLEVEEPSTYDSLSLEVKALKEMFLDFLSRTEGKDIEQLREQFQHKKEEIAGRSDD